MSRAAPVPEALKQAILASPVGIEMRYRFGRHDLCMMTATVPWRGCSKSRAVIHRSTATLNAPNGYFPRLGPVRQTVHR